MTQPTRYPIWADGRFVEAFSPVVAAEDPGFSLGLAVFETVLFESKCLYFVDEHLARLADGARVLSIEPPSRSSIRDTLREYCAKLSSDAALRVTLTRGVPGRGPSLIVGARDIQRVQDPGVKLVVSRYFKLHDDPFERIKSTNRLRNVLARDEAVARGAWDALLATEEGDLCEGTWCNLFALSGGRLITPDLSRGCLAGILRDRVLHEIGEHPLDVPIVTGRLEKLDVERADEVFCTNTTGRIVPIVEVEGLRAGLPGSAGRTVRELRARIARLEARYRSTAV